MSHSKAKQQPPLTSQLENVGVYFHVKLAPGTKFSESTSAAVREVARKNAKRAEAQRGSEHDVTVRSLFS